MSILLDAGPSLNFLAVGQENILIQVAASRGLQLAAPAKVDREIIGMCKDPRFSRTAASGTWDKLKSAHRVIVLDDEVVEDAFTAAVTRISGKPAEERKRDPRSLGEIMVLAHASVRVQQGQTVFVLMDERDGRRRAGLEDDWLVRCEAPGKLVLWNTRQVLRDAATKPDMITGGLAWETVYKQMTKFDDGLPRL